MHISRTLNSPSRQVLSEIPSSITLIPSYLVQYIVIGKEFEGGYHALIEGTKRDFSDGLGSTFDYLPVSVDEGVNSTSNFMVCPVWPGTRLPVFKLKKTLRSGQNHFARANVFICRRTPLFAEAVVAGCFSLVGLSGNPHQPTLDY